MNVQNEWCTGWTMYVMHECTEWIMYRMDSVAGECTEWIMYRMDSVTFLNQRILSTKPKFLNLKIILTPKVFIISGT